MNLYTVTDSDRTITVMAASFEAAIATWRRYDESMDQYEKGQQPTSVELINTELVVIDEAAFSYMKESLLTEERGGQALSRGVLWDVI